MISLGKLLRLLAVGSVLVALPATGRVARLEGKVVGVLAPADYIVQDKSGAKRRIRILALGIPAEGHARRAEALRELGKMSMNRPVSIEVFQLAPGCKKDEPCATFGRPTFNGLDPALALIRKGLAFHDRKQVREQSTTDRMLFTEAQTEAQKFRRGVWEEPGGSFKAPKAPGVAAPKKKKKSKKAD